MDDEDFYKDLDNCVEKEKIQIDYNTNNVN